MSNISNGNFTGRVPYGMVQKVPGQVSRQMPKASHLLEVPLENVTKTKFVQRLADKMASSESFHNNVVITAVGSENIMKEAFCSLFFSKNPDLPEKKREFLVTQGIVNSFLIVVLTAASYMTIGKGAKHLLLNKFPPVKNWLAKLPEQDGIREGAKKGIEVGLTFLSAISAIKIGMPFLSMPLTKFALDTIVRKDNSPKAKPMEEIKEAILPKPSFTSVKTQQLNGVDKWQKEIISA